MKGIENRVRIDASPRHVYKTIADPANLPSYVPGVDGAEVLAQGLGPTGTLVDLTTRHRRHLEAVVTAESRNHFLALQDSRGTVMEWELRRTPRGTLAIQRILGEFEEDEAAEIGHEARAKLFRLKESLERR